MIDQSLVDELARKLGEQVSIAGEDVCDDQGLLPEEAKVVERAVPKRRAEFAAGRRAARRALHGLGIEATAILPSASRAPKWPKGIVGSIAHDQGIALAMVAKDKHIVTLGIDVTDAAPLPGATRKTICTGDETALNPLEARAAFAIKECLYKALSPIVNSFFGFDAAVAMPSFANQEFAVRLTKDLGPYPKGKIFDGVLLNSQGMIVTALALPRDPR